MRVLLLKGFILSYIQMNQRTWCMYLLNGVSEGGNMCENLMCKIQQRNIQISMGFINTHEISSTMEMLKFLKLINLTIKKFMSQNPLKIGTLINEFLTNVENSNFVIPLSSVQNQSIIYSSLSNRRWWTELC